MTRSSAVSANEMGTDDSAASAVAGQVTLEYFILFTLVSMLSILGINAMREEVGVRKTVQDFTSGAITKISAERVEPPPAATPTPEPAPVVCGDGVCDPSEACSTATRCPMDCQGCPEGES